MIRIDADHITFTDDGHAWWVTEIDMSPGVVFGSPDWLPGLDRPCDTCDGAHGTDHDGCDFDECICDCIDGRHTFNIEAECQPCKGFGVVMRGGYPFECSHCNEGGMARITSHGRIKRRVSVVPGMILPIIDCVGAFADFSEYEDAVLHHPNVYGVPTRVVVGGVLTDIRLPPAAVPGKTFAVLLAVGS